MTAAGDRRLTSPILCLVTDRRRLSTKTSRPQTDILIDLIASACRAGIDLVQIRERDMDGGGLFDLTRRALEVARGSSTRILVNDRLDVAMAAGADGVQLRGDSIAPSRARAIVPPGFLIGRSIHSAREAAEAGASADVDFVIFGTLFATASKPQGHVTAGLEGLREAVTATTVPVLAIGGITVKNCSSVAEAGAVGLAGIGLFDVSDRPLSRQVQHLSGIVQHVRSVFDTGRGVV